MTRPRWSAVATATTGARLCSGRGIRGDRCSPYTAEGFLDSDAVFEERVETDDREDPKVPGSDTYQCQPAISFKGPSSCPAEQGEDGAVEKSHRAQVHDHSGVLRRGGGVDMHLDIAGVTHVDRPAKLDHSDPVFKEAARVPTRIRKTARLWVIATQVRARVSVA
jgi:hypothetical protein